MAAPPPGTRVALAAERGFIESWENYATERTWRVLDELEAVAAETGRTLAQVAVRWLSQAPGVTAPIIGARTVDHFADNLGAVGWTLTDDQLARLTRRARSRGVPVRHPRDPRPGPLGS